LKEGAIKELCLVREPGKALCLPLDASPAAQALLHSLTTISQSTTAVDKIRSSSTALVSESGEMRRVREWEEEKQHHHPTEPFPSYLHPHHTVSSSRTSDRDKRVIPVSGDDAREGGVTKDGPSLPVFVSCTTIGISSGPVRSKRPMSLLSLLHQIIG
jgi:hypothetical protein